ncbi:MAG: GntR family transcriptional regulator [Thermodesulfobacteriota bacterium]
MKPASISDMVRHHLEQEIFNGHIAPGSQIKEEVIALDLAISRPPIREAFKLLEAEGLVVRKPNRGVFVVEIRQRDAWEIYTLKAELYQLSIDLSFDQLTAMDLSRMGALVQAMVACAGTIPPNIVAYQELNAAFHDVHVDAAGHRRLKKMIWTLHNQIRYYSSQSLRNPDHLERSCRYHRQIWEAFQAGDKATAVKLTRDHVMAGFSRLREMTSKE